MCCIVWPMRQTFVAHTNSCSRHLYTSSSVICPYGLPRVLTHQLAKHSSDFRRRPTDSIVRLLLCSSSLSTTASCDLSQQDFCNSRLPSVAAQPVILKTSSTLNNLFCYNKATAVGQQNPVNFHQSRHYIPRQLTFSTKTIVEASPLSLQPYLRLIRFDRPIGIVTVFCLN